MVVMAARASEYRQRSKARSAKRDPGPAAADVLLQLSGTHTIRSCRMCYCMLPMNTGGLCSKHLHMGQLHMMCKAACYES